MAKKSPQLQVVGHTAKAEPYDIVSLEQLGESERERLETAIAEIEEGAGTLGVMRGVRPWDLRPVLMIFGESGPSMIRLVGPEVAHSKQITSALNAHFKRQRNVAANIFEWGDYQGQVWYRRPLFDRTLDAVLDSKVVPSVKDAFSIAEQLVKTVTDWHRCGVVHGHITPSNIALSIENEISLFDAAVAYAVISATRELGFEDFPQGYDRDTFAPEILAKGAISYSTDVFGLGFVLEKLFSKVLNVATEQSWDDITETDVQALIEFSRSMQVAELHNRPRLSVVQEFLANRGRPAPVSQATASEEQAKQKPKVSNRERGDRSASQKPIAPRVKVTVNKKTVVQPQAKQAPVVSSDLPQEKKAEEVSSVVSQDSNPAVVKESVSKNIEPKPQAEEKVSSHAPSGIDAATDSFSSNIAEDRLRPSSENFSAGPRQVSKLPTWVLMLIGAVALVAVLAFNGTFDSSRKEVVLLTDKDLVTAWHSGLPSRMSLVAQAAIHSEFPNEEARNLMLKSAIDAENLPSFNGALLRVAFSSQWEVELTDEDRRVAFALSASDLLHDDLPTDLPNLSELHPGLIFAVTATGGPRVASILSKIPAARLTDLPSPYQQAFKVLIKESPAATVGSPQIMELARFAAYGAGDVSSLIGFLEADTANGYPRMRALSYLLSRDPVRARELLNVLVGNPNAVQAVNHDLVNWAKQWQLYNWSELDGSDQLLLLAGIPIQTAISFQNSGKLLLHPVAEVRKLGLEKLLQQSRFPHPAGKKALGWAKDHADQLTPKQTLVLSHIVLKFNTITVKAVKQWLATNPPQELLQILLLGTTNSSQESPIDFELLQALKDRGWSPGQAELSQLVVHPHRVVRLFGYSKLSSGIEKDKAIVILLEARKHETVPEYIEQIERNIAVLSKE